MLGLKSYTFEIGKKKAESLRPEVSQRHTGTKKGRDKMSSGPRKSKNRGCRRLYQGFNSLNYKSKVSGL
ncbi:hypothetical protein X474_07155 [Dethiosulfatarculus sandiegensis]|uniref:Uncharacterized protein n=1 Tax=Dethiosulfatarculus sandiegensis TaxID=1429043 RepID=A0A0D2J9T6_9BACT|nr:hypothetical protein X474_07155 [Dethiosulfatarculus sandiegensis]